ncbi:MAG: hypothetical protein KGJ13_08095 [Patescibacteria group bacterium]|nr:hypothetical protein [Patescibacteria group bacterium]
MSAQSFAVIIAGILWSVVYKYVKPSVLKDRTAQWVAVLASYLIAVGAILATSGGPITPETILASGSQIAIISAVVYRQFLKSS